MGNKIHLQTIVMIYICGDKRLIVNMLQYE